MSAPAAVPVRPDGPPLRALVQALSLLIAPGGLPSGAGGSGGGGSSGPPSAVTRHAVSEHGELVMKRMSAAQLHLQDGLGSGDSASRGDMSSDSDEATMGQQGQDLLVTALRMDSMFMLQSRTRQGGGRHGGVGVEYDPHLDMVQRLARTGYYSHLDMKDGKVLSTTDKQGCVQRYDTAKPGDWFGPVNRWQVQVAIAALKVIRRMQDWVALESGPSEGRKGLGIPDYTLGSWDLRLVRFALAFIMHTLNALCVVHVQTMSMPRDTVPEVDQIVGTGVTVQYHDADGQLLDKYGKRTTGDLSARPTVTGSAIAQLLGPLLELLRPVTPPYTSPDAPPNATSGASSSSSSSTATARDAASALPSPLAMLVAPHICPILLAALLVFYDPFHAPPVYSNERADLLNTLNSLAPRVTLSALNGVLAFCRPRNAAQPTEASATSGSTRKTTPSNVDAEWYGAYPPYVPSQTSRFLTSQLMRPSGVRALLENTLPIDAEGPAQSDATGTAKAQGVARILAKAPPGVNREVYVQHVLREAQVIFSPPFLSAAGQAGATGGPEGNAEGQQGGQSKMAPRSWRLAVAETLLAMEAQSGGDVVRNGMVGVLTRASPSTDASGMDAAGPEASRAHEPAQALELARIRALALLQGIMQHASPSQDFYRRVISPSLSTLMLYASSTSPDQMADGSNTRGGTGSTEGHISKLAKNVILLYTDLVDTVAGASALYDACLANVQSGQWLLKDSAGAIAWLEDVDRTQLLSSLSTKMGEVLGTDGRAIGTAILPVHREMLGEIKDVIDERLRGLRETTLDVPGQDTPSAGH